MAKTKALISFAVTADCWFSHEAAHISCCFGIFENLCLDEYIGSESLTLFN